jgi:crotonobetainyl-CoA hydratase
VQKSRYYEEKLMESVKTSIQGHVLEIVLNRPKANAIDAETSRLLGDIFASYRDDPDLRCAILTAQGDKIFSAGWDLKAAAEDGASEDDYQGVGGFAGLTEVFDLNKPVIAAINGLAIGGGFELMLACDLIVAAKHAQFSLPETSVGVVADGGGVQRLPRRLPYFVAMELLLTGRRMDTDEAHRLGLINHVVPADQLMAKARALAQLIVDGAPLSVMATKQMVREMEALTVQAAFAASKNRVYSLHKQVLESEDHIEGPKAFAEKRKPNWKGK